MADSNAEGCKCIDTRTFDKCIRMKENYIQRYAEIVSSYDEIVKRLAENWEGEAAETFINDAKVVRTNITGIADILSTMCSALEDMRASFAECDSSLGEFNRDPQIDEGAE